MESFLIVAAVVGSFIILGLWLKKQLQDISEKVKPDETIVEWLKSNQVTMEQTNRQVTAALQQNTHALNERLDNATRVIVNVQKNIGEMSEIGRSMKQLQAS